MKKLNIAAYVFAVISITASVISCGSKRDPGRVYMPDMGGAQSGGYRTSYETYAMRDTAFFTTDGAKRGGSMIYYNNMPVLGTMKRGELFPYTISNDTVGYKMSASIKNPMDTVRFSMTEAGRLYNINCGICHGEKGAADGPIAGKIGAVANLTQPPVSALSDGTYFHVITYGKNKMGSYASQLTKQQRWQVIKYIRTLQKPAEAPADSTISKGSDSSAVVKKD